MESSLDAGFSGFTFSLGFFFQDVKVETFWSWKGDFGFFVSNDENVSTSGSESLSIGIS